MLTLEVMSGKQVGRELRVKKHEFLVGRAEGCDLRLASDEVGFRHCRIIQQESETVLRDFDGGPGTFVNGMRVAGSLPLKEGDIVEIGPMRFKVKFDDEPLPAPSRSAAGSPSSHGSRSAAGMPSGGSRSAAGMPSGGSRSAAGTPSGGSRSPAGAPSANGSRSSAGQSTHGGGVRSTSDTDLPPDAEAHRPPEGDPSQDNASILEAEIGAWLTEEAASVSRVGANVKPEMAAVYAEMSAEKTSELYRTLAVTPQTVTATRSSAEEALEALSGKKKPLQAKEKERGNFRDLAAVIQATISRYAQQKTGVEDGDVLRALVMVQKIYAGKQPVEPPRVL